MIQCHHCNGLLGPNALFCVHCGNSLGGTSHDVRPIIPTEAPLGFPAMATAQPGLLGPHQPGQRGAVAANPVLRLGGGRSLNDFWLMPLLCLLAAGAAVAVIEELGLNLPLGSRVGLALIAVWFFGILACLGGIGARSENRQARIPGLVAQGLALAGLGLSFYAVSSPVSFASHPNLIQYLVIAIVIALGGSYAAWVLSDGDDFEAPPGFRMFSLAAALAALILAVDVSYDVHKGFAAAQTPTPIVATSTAAAVTSGSSPTSSVVVTTPIAATTSSLPSYNDIYQNRSSYKLILVLGTMLFFFSLMRPVMLRMARP